MKATELPLGANEIVVSSRRRRRVVLVSGYDRLRTDGRARLAADGWEVVTADRSSGLRRLAYPPLGVEGTRIQ